MSPAPFLENNLFPYLIALLLVKDQVTTDVCYFYRLSSTPPKSVSIFLPDHKALMTTAAQLSF